MQENAFYSGKMRISFRRMKNRLEQGGKSFGAEWRVCLCLLVFGEAENARKYGFLRWKNSIWFVKTWIDEVPKCTSVASCLRKFLVNRIAWAGKQVHKERKGQILLSSWLFNLHENPLFPVRLTEKWKSRILVRQGFTFWHIVSPFRFACLLTLSLCFEREIPWLVFCGRFCLYTIKWGMGGKVLFFVDIIQCIGWGFPLPL